MAEYHTDYSVFVGDLAYEVDDALLEQTFRTYYPTTKHAKVMVDPVTGRSRGFGFVRFTQEAERDRAMQEMNGVFIGSKQIRCSLATQKPKPGSAAAGGGSSAAATGALPGGSAGGASNTSSATVAAGGRAADAAGEVNTTLFIGGLSMNVTEAELHAVFARCGEIVYTKIPQGKGCGFVQFVTRQAAEYALESLNGTILGGMPIRISWGKSSRPPPAGGAPSHSHHTPGHYPAPGYYPGHPPAYDPYGGYAYPAYDPYGGYGYGMDPYAGYPGYGVQPGAGGPGMAAAAAASAAAAAHNGAAPGTPGAIQPVLYDPLTPANPEKMNMAFMHRQVPYMTGAYVRVPIGLPMRQPI